MSILRMIFRETNTQEINSYIWNSLSIVVSFSCSIRMNSKCLLKLQLGSQKSWSALNKICLLTVFEIGVNIPKMWT